jgi:hypothetical protein
MLDHKPGRNCQVRPVFVDNTSNQHFLVPAQATNFLRSFRTIPQAPGLGLILNDDKAASPQTNLQALIHAWHTFVLTQCGKSCKMLQVFCLPLMLSVFFVSPQKVERETRGDIVALPEAFAATEDAETADTSHSEEEAHTSPFAKLWACQLNTEVGKRKVFQPLLTSSKDHLPQLQTVDFAPRSDLCADAKDARCLHFRHAGARRPGQVGKAAGCCMF